MGNIGPLEIGIVLVIILVIFGPKRLPGLGKQLGTSMREFKDSVTGDDKDEKKPELTQAQADSPSLGKKVGTNLREFKESVTGEDADDKPAESDRTTTGS
jgi:sec-independent protein translocase protein TatA